MQASHGAVVGAGREELRRELVVLAGMLHSDIAEDSSRASNRIKDLVLASNPAQVCALSSTGSMRAAGRMRRMCTPTNACCMRRKRTRTSSPASTALLKAL